MKGFISHEIEKFSLKPFCFSQRQNLLQVIARTEGYWQVSLRSWRYCLGARLKFWRRSCDLKKGVERGVWISISRGLRRQISLDYYTIPPATQATGRWNNQILCRLEAAVSSKHFPVNKRHESQISIRGRPGKQTSITKNNFTEIRPILFSLHHLLSGLMITWLAFELGTDSR